MEKESIPGMAVGIVYNGKAQTYSYCLADTKARIPVSENTIFELGSVSKTFTGLAAGYALTEGIADLSDPVRKYWPALPTAPWDNIRMLHLTTYTAGGLPLQLPDAVTDENLLSDVAASVRTRDGQELLQCQYRPVRTPDGEKEWADV